MSSNFLYVGVKAHVVAINTGDGSIVWKTKLKSASATGDRFVTLLVDEDRIFAHTYGEVHCLDAQTGGVRWTNPLEGLSYDLASLAVAGAATAPHIVKKLRLDAARKENLDAAGAAANDS